MVECHVRSHDSIVRICNFADSTRTIALSSSKLPLVPAEFTATRDGLSVLRGTDHTLANTMDEVSPQSRFALLVLACVTAVTPVENVSEWIEDWPMSS